MINMPKTLVYFVTQLHSITCLHAERDKTISHIIVYIILHHTIVNTIEHAKKGLPFITLINGTL